MNYSAMTKQELEATYAKLQEEFVACKAKNLKLDMSRGKPAKNQIDLVSDILTVLQNPEDCIVDGVDTRNYGELAGICCAREYWADILDCKAEQVFIGGSASLNLMFDVIARAYSHGLLHSQHPWCRKKL